MLELSNERIEQILHEETVKKEESTTILRAVYIRYMRLFEKYFADIDALDDDQIAKMRNYHEETGSLVRYYYMDIPQEVCSGLKEFEKRYGSGLLGPEWHNFLFDLYDEFREKYDCREKEEGYLKAEFKKEILESFYDAMDYIFRDGFGTGSQTAKKVVNGITGLLFGKDFGKG